MNTYQIFFKTERGWAYYGKTPIWSQATAIADSISKKIGCGVKIRFNGKVVNEYE